MEKVGARLKIAATTIRSERAYILSEFIKEINLDRVGTKFKQISPKVVAIKTSHLKLNDLRDFYQQCWKAKIEGRYTFSRMFFGALKCKEQS